MLQLIDNEESEKLAEFRVPASDTKGHSARQWFRCIPSMARQIEQVIQSKAFPYRTKGDILRHALHRHMQWLQTLDPVITICSQVDAMLELLRDEEMNNDFNVVFTRLDFRINHYLSDGSQEEAIRLVGVIRDHVERMPNGFWKDRYRSKLVKSYKDLLLKAPKCNLGKVED